MNADLPDISLAELEEVVFDLDGFRSDEAVNLGLAARVEAPRRFSADGG